MNFHLFSIIPDIPETGAPGSNKLCQARSHYSGANQSHPTCSTNQSINQSIFCYAAFIIIFIHLEIST